MNTIDSLLGMVATEATESGDADWPEGKYPKRAHEVQIIINADTEEDVISVLEHIAIEFARGGVRQMVSGGYSSGFTIERSHNPEMTPEQYREDLKSWLAIAKERGRVQS